jgi:TfoX/Sxy family transcriptional regulator of competence genes
MSSDENFVKFLAEQMEEAGVIRYRKMFGEFAIYCDEKVIAFVCDDKLFIKPTESGRSYIGDVVEAPAYPGSKMYFFIEDRFEDQEWLSGLIVITKNELPMPKPKTRKAKKNL